MQSRQEPPGAESMALATEGPKQPSTEYSKTCQGHREQHDLCGPGTAQLKHKTIIKRAVRSNANEENKENDK